MCLFLSARALLSVKKQFDRHGIRTVIFVFLKKPMTSKVICKMTKQPSSILYSFLLQGELSQQLSSHEHSPLDALKKSKNVKTSYLISARTYYNSATLTTSCSYRQITQLKNVPTLNVDFHCRVIFKYVRTKILRASIKQR